MREVTAEDVLAAPPTPVGGMGAAVSTAVSPTKGIADRGEGSPESPPLGGSGAVREEDLADYEGEATRKNAGSYTVNWNRGEYRPGK